MPGTSPTGLLGQTLLVEAVDESSRTRTKTHVPAGYAVAGHTGLVHRTEIDPSWQDLAVIERLVREARTVAVVGLSPDPARPSHGVARYLRSAGLRVVPVNPALTEWEGLPAYATLADVPEEIDIVDVFRRPEHAPDIAIQAVAVGAGALWLQLGVLSDQAARTAAEGGLDVVVDRCLAVEHREVVGWG